MGSRRRRALASPRCRDRRDPSRARRGRGPPVGARPHAARAPSRSSSTTARRDGSAAIAASARRARGRRAARAASAPPASPGCARPRAEVVCFMDCDGSLDPRELPRVVQPGARRRRRPRARRARGRSRGAWPCARAARQPRARARAAPAHRRRRSPISGRCAPRAARRCSTSASRDRRFGWPLEMVLRAAAAGWRIDEVAGDLPPARAGARRSPARCAGTVARGPRHGARSLA